MKEAINPSYYKDTKIEPIDVIEDWSLGFNLGSAMKYIKRAGKKEGNSRIQDLQKIKWYVEREISNEEKKYQNIQSIVRERGYVATVREDIENFWEEFGHD